MMFAMHSELGQPPRGMVLPLYSGRRVLGEGEDVCVGICAADAGLDVFRNQGYFDPNTGGWTATTAADGACAACRVIYPQRFQPPPPPLPPPPLPPPKVPAPGAQAGGYGLWLAVGGVVLVGGVAAFLLLRKKEA